MSVVVFDFDGTLADSFSVALDVYNQLAEEKGLKTVSSDDWQQLRHMHIGQGLKYVGIKTYQVPSLLSQGRKLLKDRSADIKLFSGIDSAIKELNSQGHNIFVLSTNSKIVVEAVLTDANLNKYVKVLRSAPIFGKPAALKKLIKQTGSDPDDLWMVGDELRDGQAAAKVGARFIAVNWGLQPSEILKQASPVAIVNKPGDIVKTIS